MRLIFEPTEDQKYNEGSVYILEKCHCEHCYEMEPFTACIYDKEGIGWCKCCFECGNTIDDEDLLELIEREKALKISFYEKRIIELKGE